MIWILLFSIAAHAEDFGLKIDPKPKNTFSYVPLTVFSESGIAVFDDNGMIVLQIDCDGSIELRHKVIARDKKVGKIVCRMTGEK